MKNHTIQWALSIEEHGNRRFLVQYDGGWCKLKEGRRVQLWATREEAREKKEFYRFYCKAIRVEKVQVTVEAIQ